MLNERGDLKTPHDPLEEPRVHPRVEWSPGVSFFLLLWEMTVRMSQDQEDWDVFLFLLQR